MKFKIKLLSTAFAFLCIWDSFAQDTLTYERVLDEANKSLLIKNAQLNIDLARGEYYRTNNFFPKLPELDLEYETDKFYKNEGNKLFRLTFSQEVEIAGQFSLRQDVSTFRIRKSELDYKTRNYEIIFALKTLMNNVVTLQRKLQIAKEIHEINNELLYSSERRLRAGDISELDYNLVLIETNNSSVNLRKAEIEFRNDLSKLNVYIGYDPDKTFYIDTNIIYKSVSLSLDELKTNALKNRAEIKSIEYERLATQSEISLFKMENFPNLKLSVGYSNGTGIIPGEDIIGSHNITRIQDNEKNLSFGIGFSVPFPFNGLFNFNRGNIRVAEIRSRILNNELELVRKQITSEVIVAFNNWETSKINLELLKKNNLIIESTLTLLLRGYKKGELSLINYLSEKQKLYELKLDYVEVLNEYGRSVIELEGAVQIKIQ